MVNTIVRTDVYNKSKKAGWLLDGFVFNPLQAVHPILPFPKGDPCHFHHSYSTSISGNFRTWQNTDRENKVPICSQSTAQYCCLEDSSRAWQGMTVVDRAREGQGCPQTLVGPWCLPDRLTFLVIHKNALQQEGVLCPGRCLCEQIRARASTHRYTERWLR